MEELNIPFDSIDKMAEDALKIQRLLKHNLRPVTQQDAVNAIRVNEPFHIAKFPIMTAKEAFVYVPEHAGATLPKRDAVDKRIADQVRTGKILYTGGGPNTASKYIKRRLPADSYKLGIIIHSGQVGGYPKYKGTPYKDADNYGMPDSWETQHHLNPKDAKDAVMDREHDGYINIEEYLNSVVTSK